VRMALGGNLRLRGHKLDRLRSLAAQQGTLGITVPQAPQNPFEAIWTAAPVSSHPDGTSVVVDLKSLAQGAQVRAVRYGWPLGDQGDTCCPQETVSGPSVSRIAPCIPAACPLLSAKAQLPANPWFARISATTGKCSCEPPQHCDA
jgi:hypothetical protein